MGTQLIFVLETDRRCQSDWMYINVLIHEQYDYNHSFLHDGASHRLKCFINICFYFASILPSAILSLENGLCLEHVETSGYFDTAFLSVDAILTSTDE